MDQLFGDAKPQLPAVRDGDEKDFKSEDKSDEKDVWALWGHENSPFIIKRDSFNLDWKTVSL